MPDIGIANMTPAVCHPVTQLGKRVTSFTL